MLDIICSQSGLLGVWLIYSTHAHKYGHMFSLAHTCSFRLHYLDIGWLSFAWFSGFGVRISTECSVCAEPVQSR